jgi:hypothetical protein
MAPKSSQSTNDVTISTLLVVVLVIMTAAIIAVFMITNRAVQKVRQIQAQATTTAQIQQLVQTTLQNSIDQSIHTALTTPSSAAFTDVTNIANQSILSALTNTSSPLYTALTTAVTNIVDQLLTSSTTNNIQTHLLQLVENAITNNNTNLHNAIVTVVNGSGGGVNATDITCIKAEIVRLALYTYKSIQAGQTTLQPFSLNVACTNFVLAPVLSIRVFNNFQGGSTEIQQLDKNDGHGFVYHYPRNRPFRVTIRANNPNPFPIDSGARPPDMDAYYTSLTDEDVPRPRDADYPTLSTPPTIISAQTEVDLYSIVFKPDYGDVQSTNAETNNIEHIMIGALSFGFANVFRTIMYPEVVPDVRYVIYNGYGKPFLPVTTKVSDPCIHQYRFDKTDIKTMQFSLHAINTTGQTIQRAHAFYYRRLGHNVTDVTTVQAVDNDLRPMFETLTTYDTLAPNENKRIGVGVAIYEFTPVFMTNVDSITLYVRAVEQTPMNYAQYQITDINNLVEPSTVYIMRFYDIAYNGQPYYRP